MSPPSAVVAQPWLLSELHLDIYHATVTQYGGLNHELEHTNFTYDVETLAHANMI